MRRRILAGENLKHHVGRRDPDRLEGLDKSAHDAVAKKGVVGRVHRGAGNAGERSGGLGGNEASAFAVGEHRQEDHDGVARDLPSSVDEPVVGKLEQIGRLEFARRDFRRSRVRRPATGDRSPRFPQ